MQLVLIIILSFSPTHSILSRTESCEAHFASPPFPAIHSYPMINEQFGSYRPQYSISRIPLSFPSVQSNTIHTPHLYRVPASRHLFPPFPFQAAVLLAFPSLQLPNVVRSSPGDGPDMCHVLMPAQKWQKDVPLTQYVMSQWTDVAVGPAVVEMVVLVRVKRDVDVAVIVAGNDGAGLVAQVVERRREVERMDLKEGIFYISVGILLLFFLLLL